MTSRSFIPLAAAVALIAAAPARADTCPPEAQDAVCGHVDVPFDRALPSAGTIAVAYELHRHSAPGAAKSTILVDFGGPGVSYTARREDAEGWFGPALETHDLLLVDSRGTGRSGAIDCPEYQHDPPSIIAGAASCANQLGAAATRYATRDIAADDEAVRAALGIDRLDFVGSSYGGLTAAAYATRYPRHLHSVLLDAPAGQLDDVDLFGGASAAVRRTVERVGEICARSRDCERSKAESLAAIAHLLDRLRRRPLTGTVRDADGNPHDVNIDATYLLVHIIDNQSGLLGSTGELPAAIDALDRGDETPLLRLALEGDFDIPGDSGDPLVYSQGANTATGCVDSPKPWSPFAPLVVRQAQYERAVARTSDRPFAPFRAEEIMFSPFPGAVFCLPWPGTGTKPAVKHGARYPRVPTLVLNGQFDIGAEMVRKTAALWPEAKVVEFRGTVHTPLEATRCARVIAQAFIETLDAGDTSCAARSTWDYPGVTSFPRRALASPAATARPGDRSGPLGLRVERVATDTALDALKRIFLNGPDYLGLRGGRVHVDFDNGFVVTLDGARWTNDVAVSGPIHWTFDGGRMDADLTVDGPGQLDGTLHLDGGWLIPGAPRTVTITGTLAGKPVAAKAPAG